MKRSLFALISCLILANTAFAESVVVTETKTWKSVPITVDQSAGTYTVVGTMPVDSTEYYYTYSGYRCFQTRQNFAGIDAVVFKAGVSTGSDIYCYPEQ